MLLMMGFASSNAFVVETDPIAHDMLAPVSEAASKRASVSLLADNVNYEEELMLEIWRDGSVKSVWKFEDAGRGILGFPTSLPVPLNSSYPRVRDIRMDFLISETPQLSSEWGFMADYDEFGDSDREYAAFSSNEILVRLQVWNESNALNETLLIAEEIIDNISLELGIDFHLMTNTTGFYDGDYGLEQSWRGFLFDLASTWQDLFPLLPLEDGLATIETLRLMQAASRSLHIVADWDEMPNRGGSTGLFALDERWEFETTFGIIEKEKISLNSSSNKIYLNELIDFGNELRTHSKTNDSDVYLRIPYGSRINEFDISNPGDVYDICFIEIDVDTDHNQHISDSYFINFTLDALPMPNLQIHATANSTVVSPGDIVEINYKLTNYGNSPAYNVRLWGFDNTSGAPNDEYNWNFINVTQQNYNYTFWDSTGAIDEGRAYFDFAQIAPGASVSHTVVLNATTPTSQVNETFVSESYVNYDGIQAPATPRGWVEEDIETAGNDLVFWYNHSNPGPTFSLDTWVSSSVVRVGEELTVFANVTNTGTIPAWDIAWEAPRFGFNTSNLNGVITYLNTSDSVVVNTTYIVDAATRYLIDYASYSDISLDSAPTRQLGGVVDLGSWGRPDSDDGRDYSWWYLDGWWANNSYFPINNPNWNSGDVYGSEIRLHVLPAANQTFGPFLTVQVDYSSADLSSEERLTVSVTVQNVGDMPAENIDVTSEYSDSEFNFFAGVGTDNTQSAPQGRRVELQWGILEPGDSFTFSYQLTALKNTTSYTYTYAATDWMDFPGLARVFYPRTFDWEAPIIDGPADHEIIRSESVASTGNLSWSLLDEHSGNYRILRANASSAIPSDNASAISSANLTFVEVASGTWSTAFSNYTHSLAGLNDGFYLFTFEATDCCGNIATDMVAVTVTTACEPLILSGPADLEIIRKKGAAITDSLSWGLSAGNSGTYRILRANASIVASGNAYMISTANLTFVEVASGVRTSTTSQITHSLAGLNDGFYLFTLEVIDYCGVLANDTAIVIVGTQPEEEDEGLIEDFQNFLSENAGFLLITGALAVIVIAEGVVIYFTRKE
jgi:hypothetical protein